jgi:hypothetical protein
VDLHFLHSFRVYYRTFSPAIVNKCPSDATLVFSWHARPWRHDKTTLVTGVVLGTSCLRPPSGSRTSTTPSRRAWAEVSVRSPSADSLFSSSKHRGRDSATRVAADNFHTRNGWSFGIFFTRFECGFHPHRFLDWSAAVVPSGTLVGPGLPASPAPAVSPSPSRTSR